MSLAVEGRQPVVPWTADDEPHDATAEQAGLMDDDEQPARRRRGSLLGGAALVAASSVAVAAGLFVPGFTALGLGSLLLLLPPTVPRERKRRSPLRVVRTWAAAGGDRVVALARSSVHAGAGAFKSVEHFAANEGRDGVMRIGRASADGAAAVGHAATAAGARVWSGAQVVGLGIWRGFIEATRSFVREARSISIGAWERSRPILRRAWVVCLAGSRRAAHELAATQRAASEQLSALIDARSGPRQLGAVPPRARRPPARTTAEPVRRAPAARSGSRVRSGRSRRSPPPSR